MLFYNTQTEGLIQIILDTIRYLSLHDNSYIRYFKGHKGRVHSLEVSPLGDWVLSGSDDNTVRLWDLRSPSCQVRNHSKFS